MEVQYYKLLFGKNANVGELIKAFDGAKIVDELGGYGKPKKYRPSENADLRIQLISDDDVKLPESPDDTYEKFHILASERDDLKKELRELKEKLKNIEQATKGETCQ
jgi:hypothetical protein